MHDELRTAFRELPHQQGAALWLAYRGQHSTEHIAAELHVSEAEAKSLLHHSMHALRRALPSNAAVPATTVEVNEQTDPPA